MVFENMLRALTMHFTLGLLAPLGIPVIYILAIITVSAFRWTAVSLYKPNYNYHQNKY
jgi:hypothetical protein